MPEHVLPRPATPLVGRQNELAVVALNLADPQCSVLTLLGPGGTGKTRLALEAGQVQVELAHFSGGIFFVPLDVISGGELLATRIAEVLGIGLQGREDVLTQVIGHIGDKKMLLVLDNFEQLMDAALLVSDLVQACPRLTILVTSRERLNLEEEWVLPVQGLQLPAQVDISLEEAQRCDAIQLFVQRARRVQLGFALLQQDLPHVSRVCHLVQGLPLGLELAAAWVKMTSCAEIAREIQANLDFLASSSRNVNERHKSLRATFEYSWRLLSPGEQDVLRRLSVFRGGFTRETAQAVAGASLAALASLVDKSLLQTAPEGRYDLHPLLHQYCREKLAERPEEQAETEDRHGGFLQRFLEDLRADLRGPRQVEVQRAIERELENVRAAWQWALNGKKLEFLLEAGPSLDVFFDNTGRYREAAATFGRSAEALSEADPTYHAVLGEMLASQAFALFRLGRYQEGAAAAERSLRLLRPLGRMKGVESALNSLGAIAIHTGDYEQARLHWQELLEIVKAHEGNRELAVVLGNLGTLEYALGNYARAKQYGQEGLALNRKLNLVEGVVSSLNNLGNVLLSMGDAKEAQPLLEEGLRLAQEANHQLVIPRLLGLLGDVFYELGDYPRAKLHNEEALLLAREHGDQAVEASRLRTLGTLATATGDYAEAQTYFRQSLQLHLAMQALPSAMNAVLGLAQLHAQRGRQAEALSLLALTLHHPATDMPVKDEARGLLEKWQSEVAPDLLQEALDRGRSMRLEELVV